MKSNQRILHGDGSNFGLFQRLVSSCLQHSH